MSKTPLQAKRKGEMKRGKKKRINKKSRGRGRRNESISNIIGIILANLEIYKLCKKIEDFL